MIKRTAYLLLATLLPASARSSDFDRSRRGDSSARILEIGVGARALAMGEAYAAVADDPTAVFWNPAALTDISRPAISVSHAQHLGGTYLEHAYLAYPIAKDWVMGLGVGYWGLGTVTRTDQAGTEEGVLNPHEVVASASLSRALFAGISAGLSAKFVRTRLLDAAAGFAVDAGILSPWFFNNQLRAALTASNIGSPIRYENADESLPTRIRTGLAYKLSPGWLWSWDVEFPRSNQPSLAMGTEYWTGHRNLDFAWRLGYNTRSEHDIAGVSGLSLGLGLGKASVGIDYALVPFGSVGLTHRVSLNYGFGRAP